MRSKPMILGIEPSPAQTGSDPFDVFTGRRLAEFAGCRDLKELREHFYLYDLYKEEGVRDHERAVHRFRTSWKWFAPVVLLMGMPVYEPFRDAYGLELDEFVFSHCRLINEKGAADVWVTRIPHPSPANMSFNRYDVAYFRKAMQQALHLAVANIGSPV